MTLRNRSRGILADAPSSALTTYTTAAGRTRTNPPPGLEDNLPSSQILLAQLLHAQQVQNELFTRQLELLQSQELPVYSNPSDILKSVDPDIRNILAEWSREYKNALHQCVTQRDLQTKYADLETSGSLHKQFADECKKGDGSAIHGQCQEIGFLPPILEENQVDMFVDGEVAFDICSAFKEMRQRNARECHNFVLAYQCQCCQFFEKRANHEHQFSLLKDKLVAWFGKFGPAFSSSAKQAVNKQTIQFAELTSRTEHPKAVSRHEKDLANKAKQKEEILKAEAEFRTMDVTKLLAAAVLEHSALQSSNQHNRSSRSTSKQQVVHQFGALAFFVKQYPELAENVNITVRKQRTLSKASSSRRPSTRGRSASQAFAGSRKWQASRKSRTSHSARSSKRGSSRRSHKSQRSSASQSKGKGHKGKGKGKISGKDKHQKEMRLKSPGSKRS